MSWKVRIGKRDQIIERIETVSEYFDHKSMN